MRARAHKCIYTCTEYMFGPMHVHMSVFTSPMRKKCAE